MSEIIRIENLHFRYGDSEKEVLRGIDLSVQQGEFVAVLGHNGSGKSTLAKHINAILLPTEGKVTVDGIDTADESRLYELRQTAGMGFQNPDNQIVSSVVEEDVAFALENLGVPYEEMRERVDEALRTVGMYDLRLHSPSQLSGGQKQRVAIAGVIAMQPKCLILDESTAMLDPKGRKEVLATVRRMNREYGMTVLLITHYMEEAAGCDRVVVMDGGSIIMDGKPEKVFSQVSPEIITGEECADALARLLGS